MTVQEKAPSAFSKKLQIICGLGLVLLLAYMGVSGLTLREVPCPSNMVSDIGTPVAMGFMEAWERGDSLEPYMWRGRKVPDFAQPGEWWIEYSHKSSVREFEYERSGCVRKGIMRWPSSFLEDRTWHLFWVTIGSPGNDPSQDMLYIRTVRKESEWKIKMVSFFSQGVEGEGIFERFSRSGSGLRDFLPKAGSIAKYKGLRVYKDGRRTKFTKTVHLDWRREKGKDYFVSTSRQEEKASGSGSEAFQVTELTVVMELKSDHLVWVSGSMRKQGLENIEYETTFDPPLVLLKWPLEKGEKWDQSYQIRVDQTGSPPQMGTGRSLVTVRGEDRMGTPAGVFRTWRIDKTTGNQQVTGWWAKGKWEVKWHVDGPVREKGQLVEFKEPKF